MNEPLDADFDPIRLVTVLSVSPNEDDQRILERAFRGFEATLYPNCRLQLRRSATLASAFAVLEASRIPIVLCDGDFQAGAWREMLERLRVLPAPPRLIVVSRFADDRMWAEALNLGAHDVLAKPFDGAEVVRTINSAWLHWQHRHGHPAGAREGTKRSTGT